MKTHSLLPSTALALTLGATACQNENPAPAAVQDQPQLTSTSGAHHPMDELALANQERAGFWATGASLTVPGYAYSALMRIGRPRRMLSDARAGIQCETGVLQPEEVAHLEEEGVEGVEARRHVGPRHLPVGSDDSYPLGHGVDRPGGALLGRDRCVGDDGNVEVVDELPGVSDTEHLSDWDPPFPLDLKRIRPEDEAYWATIQRAFDLWGQQLWSPVPVQVASGQNRLIVTLFDIQYQCDFIRFDPDDDRIADVRSQPTGDTTADIAVAVPGMCGYRYEYTDEGLVLTVKTMPKTPEDIRILVDAGHGGEEDGAIGLDGVPEKERNLITANRLVFALEESGFQVKSTRLGDQTVSLEERGRIARTFDPHIILSLHHNALPDGRDPVNHRGVCCLYYQPFARPLADTLQSHLILATAMANGGAGQWPGPGT